MNTLDRCFPNMDAYKYNHTKYKASVLTFNVHYIYYKEYDWNILHYSLYEQYNWNIIREYYDSW